MSKILVTGAAGFIGSHVCEALLKRGDAVIGIDNFDEFYPREVKDQNVTGLRGSRTFRLYVVDIRDAVALGALFAGEKIDAVIHLAARAGVRDSISNPRLYVDININGTLNVLEAMKRHSVPRLVFASSSSVYGGVKSIPYHESHPVIAISPYASTKVAGEALCAAYSETCDMSVVCCRFFTVYGPRQRPDMAITRFAQALTSGQPVTIFGDGSSARDYTFIDDIVRGVIAALDSNCRYEIVNLGSTVPIQLSSVIQLLAESLGVTPKLEFAPIQRGEPLVTLADTSKALSLFGYSPRIQFHEGLKIFARWFEKQSASSGVAART